jgi:hypothetical protein
MANKNDLNPGQKLWFVPGMNHRNESPRFVTISKVGRKFFEVSEILYSRFFIDTLSADGQGHCPIGCCYLDQAPWLNRQAWEEFQLKVEKARTTPSGATVDSINQVAKLLGL